MEQQQLQLPARGALGAAKTFRTPPLQSERSKAGLTLPQQQSSQSHSSSSNSSDHSGGSKRSSSDSCSSSKSSISNSSKWTIGGILLLHRGTRGELRQHDRLQGVLLQQLRSGVQAAAAVFEPPCPHRSRRRLLQQTLKAFGPHALQQQQQQQQQEQQQQRHAEGERDNSSTTVPGSAAADAEAADPTATSCGGSGTMKPTRCICLFASSSSGSSSSGNTADCTCCCASCSSISDGVAAAAADCCCCSTCCDVLLRYSGGPDLTAFCCIEQEPPPFQKQQQQQLLLATEEGTLISVLSALNPSGSGKGSSSSRRSSRGMKALRVGSKGHAYGVWGGVSHALVANQDGLFGLGSCCHGQLLQRHPVSCCFIPRLLFFAAAPRCSIISLCCSTQHVVAAAADGRCFTWGSNTCGELGIGTTAKQQQQRQPQQLQLPQPITAVAAGEGFSIAAAEAGGDTRGGVWAWGLNCWGQLGLGDTNPRYTPQQILHACYRASSSSSNSSSSSSSSSDIVACSALPPIKQVAAGAGFAALLAASGALLLQGRAPSKCTDIAQQQSCSSCCSGFAAVCGDSRVPTEIGLEAACPLRFSRLACGGSALVAFAPAQLQQVSPQLLPLGGGGLLKLKLQGFPMLQQQKQQQHLCCWCCCCSRRPGGAALTCEAQAAQPLQPALLRLQLDDSDSIQQQQLDFLLKAWLCPGGLVVCRCPRLRAAKETVDFRISDVSTDEILSFEAYQDEDRLRVDQLTCAWEGTAAAAEQHEDAQKQQVQQQQQHCTGWCVFGKRGDTEETPFRLETMRLSSVLPLAPRGPLVGARKRQLKHWLELQRRTAGDRILSASIQVSLDGSHWSLPSPLRVFFSAFPEELMLGGCEAGGLTLEVLLNRPVPEGADCSGAAFRFSVPAEEHHHQQQQQQEGDGWTFRCYVPAAVSANRQALTCVAPAFSEALLSTCLLRVDASLNGEQFTKRSAAFFLMSPESFSLSPPIGAARLPTTVKIRTPQLERLNQNTLRELELQFNRSSSSKRDGCCCVLVRPDGSKETIPARMRNGYVEATLPPFMLECEESAGVGESQQQEQQQQLLQQQVARDDSEVQPKARSNSLLELQIFFSFNGHEFSSTSQTFAVYRQLQPEQLLLFRLPTAATAAPEEAVPTLSPGEDQGLENQSSATGGQEPLAGAAAGAAGAASGESASPTAAAAAAAAAVCAGDVLLVDEDTLICGGTFAAVLVECAAPVHAACFRLSAHPEAPAAAAPHHQCSSSGPRQSHGARRSIHPTGAETAAAAADAASAAASTAPENECDSSPVELIVPAACTTGVQQHVIAVFEASSIRAHNRRGPSRDKAAKQGAKKSPAAIPTGAPGKAATTPAAASAGGSPKGTPADKQQTQMKEQQQKAGKGPQQQQQQRQPVTPKEDSEEEGLLKLIVCQLPSLSGPTGGCCNCILEISVDGIHFFPAGEGRVLKLKRERHTRPRLCNSSSAAAHDDAIAAAAVADASATAAAFPVLAELMKAETAAAN
ncbi:hypothetical protein Esti_003588 [Eimeria stiedai]